MHVPMCWVLLIAYALATTVLPACSSQLLSTDPTIDLLSENPEVGEDYSALSVDKCTLVKVSWRYTNMANLSSEQKQVIKCLYKNGAKIVNSESHVDFLSSSIQNKFIPKSFKVNTVLPGVKEVNQERFDKVSFECIKDEKFRHENVLKAAKLEFEKSKSKLVELFDSDAAEREIKRLEEHLEKIRAKLRTKKQRKPSEIHKKTKIIVMLLLPLMMVSACKHTKRENENLEEFICNLNQKNAEREKVDNFSH